MGYHAYGGGAFALKDSENASKELDLNRLNEISSCQFYIDGDDLVAEVEDGRNYWSDQYDEVLDIITPFVSSGEIELIGDDNTRWRFIYKDGKIISENAEYYYPGEAEQPWRQHYENLLSSVSTATHGKQQYFVESADRIYSRVSESYLTAAEVLREYLFELQNLVRR